MQMILQKRFRERVLHELAKKRWTKSDLARAMAVSPGYVGDYLAGRKSPGLDVLEKFAIALEVDPAELIADRQLVG